MLHVASFDRSDVVNTRCSDNLQLVRKPGRLTTLEPESPHLAVRFFDYMPLCIRSV